MRKKGHFGVSSVRMSINRVTKSEQTSLVETTELRAL